VRLRQAAARPRRDGLCKIGPKFRPRRFPLVPVVRDPRAATSRSEPNHQGHFRTHSG